jgi:hypothetical protein
LHPSDSEKLTANGFQWPCPIPFPAPGFNNENNSKSLIGKAELSECRIFTDKGPDMFAIFDRR